MYRLHKNRTRSGGLVLALLLLTVFLASCGGDDPADPVVTNHAPTTPAIDTASGAPAHEATDVALNAQLHWTCSDPDGDSLTYTVSFGTAGNLDIVAQSQPAASYTPAGLAHFTTYYWQVSVSDDGGKSTNSPTWSFTTIDEATETVSAPNTPTGSAGGLTTQTLYYITSGAVSSMGHTVEYRFDWDDGTPSVWGPGSSTGHTWTTVGSYDVTAQARCSTDTGIVSAMSSALTVVISEPADETVNSPGTPTGDDLFSVGGSERSSPTRAPDPSSTLGRSSCGIFSPQSDFASAT